VTKIADAQIQIVVDQCIVELQIAVNDTLLMNKLQNVQVLTQVEPAKLFVVSFLKLGYIIKN
jgi:hypothetical protein